MQPVSILSMSNNTFRYFGQEGSTAVFSCCVLRSLLQKLETIRPMIYRCMHLAMYIKLEHHMLS